MLIFIYSFVDIMNLFVWSFMLNVYNLNWYFFFIIVYIGRDMNMWVYIFVYIYKVSIVYIK